MIRKSWAVAMALLSSLSAALAQSSPGLVTGQVPSAAQWNSYFSAKQDTLGFTPLNRAGGGMTGRLITVAPSASVSGFNLPHGTAPAIPANGDLWTTSAGIFAQISGVTNQLASTAYVLNSNTALNGINLSNYGASGSGRVTTGNISAGDTALTVLSSLDFANGQGVLVNHAGAAYALAQPTSVTAVQLGTTGSTNYYYRVSSCNDTGGVGGAAASVHVANGVAAPGVSNTILISWTLAAGANCYVIWKSLDDVTYALLSVVGSQGTFEDGSTGPIPMARPFWVPPTPPATDLANWLVTTIFAGGGTTTLTLGTVATTAASATYVAHDDTTAWNAWIDALNAASVGGTVSVVGTIPPNYSVRISSSAHALTNSNTHIRGNGASCLPAGAGAINCMYFKGFGATGVGGALNILEGKITTISTNGVAGYADGVYIVVTQPAPSGGAYRFISPVSQVVGTNITMVTSSPVAYAATINNIAVGGTTITPTDVMTLTASVGLTGAVTHTVVMGDTTTTIAEALAVAINKKWNAGNETVAYTDGANNIKIVSASLGTIWTPSVSGGATETLTQSFAPFSTYSWFVPIVNVGVSDLNGDGTNSAGNGINLVWMESTSSSTVRSVHGSHFSGGSVFVSVDGYANTYDDIIATLSGNGNHNAIEILDTASSLQAVRAIQSTGFGIGLEGNWLQVTNLASHEAFGRPLKLGSVVHSQFTNVIASGGWRDNGVNTTGLGLTNGAYKNTFINASVSSSYLGIWGAGMFDRQNTFIGGDLVGNTVDANFNTSDQGNSFIGTRMATIFDFGSSFTNFNISTGNGNAVDNVITTPVVWREGVQAITGGALPFIGTDSLGGIVINASPTGSVVMENNGLQKMLVDTSLTLFMLPSCGAGIQTSGMGVASCVSSRDLKNHIEYLDDTLALAYAMGLMPRTFQRNNDPGVTHFGFIAEEVEGVAHDLAGHDKDGKPMNVKDLLAVAIGAIKAQQKQIDELRAQIGPQIKRKRR